MSLKLQARGHTMRTVCCLGLAILLAAALVLVTDGCAPRPARMVVVTQPSTSVEVVYVQKAPPGPRAEVKPPRPTRKAVWVPGYWRWDGNSYVWVQGHWEKKPRGSAWVPGHWDKKPRGWVWVPGHWR
ncbi:hypothetical protein AMJ71_02350 [candidate division TA06 bacterium SM1_40]|jgi:hypothetical protein|uniref:YXWGXW repeat-containing protein n=1 Tax=candidate division TA06 bacterium SM1_40 TaxID=1703773 RepID=A0A0S8JLW1_UNCT6|nr:MAG: hypothetical protein AMJ71_02350 [candidate division TA06 bacterium SM1_40]